MTDNKNIPTLFENKEDCCGCTACYSICPVKAIAMVADEEGFEYPLIDETICVGCKKCVSVCPCHMTKEEKNGAAF